MEKKLDLRKVEAALKRAAANAKLGPKEVRAGRFVARDSATGRFAEDTTLNNKRIQSTKK